ncbi:MAG: ATP-dependent metallopeptidase FtsH/Yme1/Tma family protein [Longimicrobiales bacterium]
MRDVVQRLARGDFAAAGRRIVSLKVPLLVGALAISLIAVAVTMLSMRAARVDNLNYTELLAALDAGRVATLTIESGHRVTGTWRGAAETGFVTAFTQDDASALVARAEQAGVAVAFAPAGRSQRVQNGLIIALELLLIGGLAYLFFQHVRGQRGGDVGRRGDGGTTTFDDVAGTQGAAEELREMVEFLRAPAAFTRMGAHVPKGVLLVGPPGTGKTLLARAVAGEAGVPFLQLSGSEVTGFVVGLGAHRIRSLFKRARRDGAVIFIDELDALGGVRGRNRSHNEDDRTLNQLLVEMDGFAPADGVIVIAATNRPDELDPALKRPGRFDRIVTVGLPSVDGREAILRLHATRRAIPLNPDVDVRRLAKLTPGASGADLANLLNEAAIAAVRLASADVEWAHIEIARDRMLLGKERVGFTAPNHEWRVVAYHEAGHALAGAVGCPDDGLHKVTIQPRGRAMGVAHFAPDDDMHLYSRRYLEGQIIKGFGGRVAEELTFGADAVTGGAESDLVHVNRIARQMVYRLAMGAKGGLLVHDDDSAPLSANAQADMDAEVQALLERLYARTRDILTSHQPALVALAEALLERETIEGDEAIVILSEAGAPVGGGVPA